MIFFHPGNGKVAILLLVCFSVSIFGTQQANTLWEFKAEVIS
jgi:hypothetical protein